MNRRTVSRSITSSSGSSQAPVWPVSSPAVIEYSLCCAGSAEREWVAGGPGQLDPHRLGLGEVLHGVDAVLATDAAVAHAAERNMRGDNAIRVDPYRPGPQLRGHPVRPVDVIGPHGAGQTELGGVGRCDR